MRNAKRSAANESNRALRWTLGLALGVAPLGCSSDGSETDAGPSEEGDASTTDPTGTGDAPGSESPLTAADGSTSGVDGGDTSSGQTDETGEPGETYDEVFESGTRLRAVVQGDVDGGAVRLSHWHDTQTDRDCSPMADVDGTSCKPAQFAIVRYLDAACQQPVMRLTDSNIADCAANGTWASVVVPSPSQCQTDLDVFELGDPVATPASGFYGLDARGTCIPSASLESYRLATPIDDAMFASFEEIEVDYDQGLGASVLVSDDGAYVRRSARDLGRDVSCFAYSHEGQTRCYPASMATISLTIWSDANCENEVAVTQACFPASYAATPMTQDLAPRVFELGAPLDTVYTMSGSSCVPVDVSTSSLAFNVVGSELDVAAFPAMELAMAGSGRLRLETFTTPAGERLASGRFWDDELARACTHGRDGNGAPVCLASTYVYNDSNLFADAACTDAEAVFPIWSDPVPARLGVEGTAPSCSTPSGSVVAELYATGADYTGPLYGRIPDGAGGLVCSPVQSYGVPYVRRGAPAAFLEIPNVQL